uniref:Uncharacterized protein n=1 Tax=Rhizophora mucronata TaxID=61149 RepID=A0A2P2IY94_RHIMU
MVKPHHAYPLSKFGKLQQGGAATHGYPATVIRQEITNLHFYSPPCRHELVRLPSHISISPCNH